MKPMHSAYQLSAILASPPLEFDAALAQAGAAGFDYVDVVGLVERPTSHLEALADSGLMVGCGKLGSDLPDDHTLDAPSPALRRATLQIMRAQVADLARLGATHAFLAPTKDGSTHGLARFSEACQLLADHAGQRMVKLCLAHVIGSALPDAARVLAWLEQVDHENLGLLLDMRQCSGPNEDVAATIALARHRLRCVHLDGYPAESRFPCDTLKAILGAMMTCGYEGNLALRPRTSTVEGLVQQRESWQQMLHDVRDETEV
jgi:sugar phosphate isomerase/epimerase